MRGSSSPFHPVRALGTRFGNRRHSAAKAETKDCELASHRAFDSQPRGRLRSAVSYRAPRRCAPAARFQQCSVQRPSVTISNRTAGRSIRSGISKDRDWGFVRCQSIRQRPPATGIPARFAVRGGLSVTIVRVTQCDRRVAGIRISAQDYARYSSGHDERDGVASPADAREPRRPPDWNSRPDCTLRLTFTPNSLAAVRSAWNGILQAQETLNYEPLEPRDDRP